MYNNGNYWTLSPSAMLSDDSTIVGYVSNEGNIGGGYINLNSSVRPVISLKSGTIVEPIGSGTTTNPYVVK